MLAGNKLIKKLLTVGSLYNIISSAVKKFFQRRSIRYMQSIIHLMVRGGADIRGILKFLVELHARLVIL
jgi:hypothetical protein